MLRFTSAAVTARRLPSCIAGRASSLASSPAFRPPVTSLRCRPSDAARFRVFASSSAANEGAESPSSPTSSASASTPEQSTPSLSRESRQSETQAINLRAIKQSDQIGAAAEQLKKRLGGERAGGEREIGFSFFLFSLFFRSIPLFQKPRHNRATTFNL